jgi:hypothetical protein
MDSLLVGAFWVIAVMVGLSLGLALSSADPIGRFLRRQLWPDAEGGAPVENEAMSADRPEFGRRSASVIIHVPRTDLLPPIDF